LKIVAELLLDDAYFPFASAAVDDICLSIFKEWSFWTLKVLSLIHFSNEGLTL